MIDRTPSTRSLVELESVIERGIATFVDVGAALLEIRENRLYRESHESFETYCRDRWGFSRQRAYQMIEAAGVASELSNTLDIAPPHNSRQAAELARVPAPQRAEVWQRATAQYGERVTARHIREIVRPEPATATPRRYAVVEAQSADVLDDGDASGAIAAQDAAEESQDGQAHPQVADVAYRLSDDAGRAELDRWRYLKALSATLGHVTGLTTQYDPTDVAAYIDPDFLRLNIDIPLDNALRWADRVRAAMPEALRVIPGGRS